MSYLGEAATYVGAGIVVVGGLLAAAYLKGIRRGNQLADEAKARQHLAETQQLVGDAVARGDDDEVQRALLNELAKGKGHE